MRFCLFIASFLKKINYATTATHTKTALVTIKWPRLPSIYMLQFAFTCSKTPDVATDAFNNDGGYIQSLMEIRASFIF